MKRLTFLDGSKVYNSQKEGRAITELSFESQIIYERLKKCEIGDFVSYKELSDIIGRNIQLFRGPLHTARNILVREGRVFDIVVNEGLKRLSDEEIVHKQRKTAKHVRHVTRKSNRELGVVNPQALSPQTLIEHNALATYNSLTALFSTPHTIKKIEKRVEQTQARIPPGKMLDIFK